MVSIAPGSAPAGSDREPSYLAYLDLDMAFTAADFVDVDPKSSRFGEVGQDAQEFRGVRLAFENANFMEVIAGNDTTTGVPPLAQARTSALPTALALAREALYDAMMHGYLHAYGGGGGDGGDAASGYRVAPYDARLHAAGMCVLRLALIKQADYIA